jgi:hypothetical protein
VLDDPEVNPLALRAERLQRVPKGFEEDALSLWRVVPG